MERGGAGYIPYFDPDFDSLIERINPPSVCVDNDTCDDCTLVKVDSANKHGVLLEMVQLLTDLDLVISKSYICSDGGWFMDVFHVTDQLGDKITDPSLIRYIELSMVTGRSTRGCAAGEVRTCLGRVVAPRRLSEYTALELTGTDRPGLLSEISAVLAELDCHVASAQAWSHSSRVAMLLYLTDLPTGKPISGKDRLARIEAQVENVFGAHHDAEERRWVRIVGPTSGWVHTERRLHQLMRADRDYEEEDITSSGEARGVGMGKIETRVSIECCREKGYSVVNVRSRDRPKLLFDTVCTLTDMDYAVSHATVSSHGPLAVQEYFIRRKDGHALDCESESRRVARCLVAAIERRASHGLRFNVCTVNRTGLLSDITRVFREQGLSLTRAEIGTRGEKAIGTFFVVDASGGEVDPETVESVRREIGEAVALEVKRSPLWHLTNKSMSTPTGSCGGGMEVKRSFSLGSLLWSGLERFSHNFGYTIRP